MEDKDDGEGTRRMVINLLFWKIKRKRVDGEEEGQIVDGGEKDGREKGYF